MNIDIVIDEQIDKKLIDIMYLALKEFTKSADLEYVLAFTALHAYKLGINTPVSNEVKNELTHIITTALKAYIAKEINLEGVLAETALHAYTLSAEH